MNRLAAVLSIGLVSSLPVVISAQTLVPVDSASTISFRIKNLGFNTTGHFSGLTGTIHFVSSNLGECRFDVQVPATSVNSGVDMRDNHLRGAEYFDVKNYPQISFVSAKVTSSNKSGTLFVFGKLTIRGVTKEISFPFKATPVANGYRFEGEFKLNKKDFRIGGGATMSDNLTVSLNVLTRKT